MPHDFGRELPLSSVRMTYNERVGETQIAYGLRPERRMTPGVRRVGPRHVLFAWPLPSTHHPYSRLPKQP